MAEEVVKQEALSAEKSQKKPEEKKPTETQPVSNQPKSTNIGLIFGIINLVLILVFAGGGLYLLLETKDKQVAQSNEINKDDLREIEVSKQINVFQSQLAAMQSTIATFNDEVTGKDTHYSKILADFSQLHSEKLDLTNKDLGKEINQLKRQLGKTRGDWLLADAEYLLTVANQRLHLMGDTNTAILALEAADQRLRESGDTAAYKIREQVAKEISGLKTVTETDVVATYSSLQLLKGKVSELAVILPYAGKPLTESTEIHEHAEKQESTHGVLNSALHLLEGYVTVRHSDQPVTEILTEEEVVFIREQLNVKLEMVKIALVQQNDALYEASIDDTKKWLQGNFTINTKAKSFLAELDRLKAIKIRSQYPDVSLSLKMLKDITKLRIETDKAQSEPDQDLATDVPVVEQ